MHDIHVTVVLADAIAEANRLLAVY